MPITATATVAPPPSHLHEILKTQILKAGREGVPDSDVSDLEECLLNIRCG